jgi:serine/threonine protein kinase
MSNLTGQSLGRYHILEPLGEGGMAIVYKAYDTRLESEVAVKVIRIEKLSPEILQRALKRFEREAKSLAKLAHPNIVNVLDYGEYNGQPYLVMPYIPGGTLKQLLNGKPMNWQKAARLLIPIARALDYAHKRDIVHRDVKPSNILITESGEPMLTDFGVAKIIDEEATLDLTGTSATVGTPEYMAPEQATSKTTDHRVDIYALGIVFYEMVAGRKPFQADTPLAILFKQASEPLPRLNMFVKGIPDQVERILVKALAKKPENRYQTMSEFARVLEDGAGGRTARINEPSDRGPQINLPNLPRKVLINIGLAVLVIGLFAILSKPLSGLSTQIFTTTTPGNAPTSTYTSTPAHTKTPQVTNTPMATAIPELGIGSTMTGEDGATLVYVPAGEFTMGGDVNSDEKPIHTVNLDAFWIDQTEVTNKLFSSFVIATGYQTDAEKAGWSYMFNNPDWVETNGADWQHPTGPGSNVTRKDQHPTINVSWNDATAYCEWVGRRLPTEAEWEKAARGTDARIYPWGNAAPNDTLLNYNNNIGDTTEVDIYETGKNIYGAYDMAGNVWEWVNDWYSETYYQSSPSSNPLGPNLGEYRVLRGGAWNISSDYVRSASRNWDDPINPYYDLGFRCARSHP